MSVSIVIPHYGDADLLGGCVDAIVWHTDDYELVVVDNGTGVPVHANVVIRNPQNRGFAVACNQGAAAAHAAHLVFLNNDTEVQAGWLEPLVARLNRGAGIVGSLLRYPSGTVQHAGVALHRDPAGVLVAENRRGDYSPGRVEAVTGACLAIRRDLFWQLGGFDTGYHNGYEDVDLCLTARAAGHTVVFEPASVVVHHESASGPARWTHVRQNVARLQQRWAAYEPVGAVA